jgi:integrase/recombinase XerC
VKPAKQIKTLFEEFLQHKRRGGATAITLQDYERDLYNMLAFLHEHGHAINLLQLRTWVDSQMGRRLAPATIARRVSTVRSFCLWCMEEGHWPINPADGLEAPQTRPTPAQSLSIDEVARLRAILTTPLLMSSTLQSIAVFELLYGAAMRVGEVCCAQVGDVDLNRGFIRVRGKGARQRMIPLGPAPSAALATHMETRTSTFKNAPLFNPQNNSPRPLTARDVQRMITTLGERAGIPDVWPHLLRHSAATHMIEAGVPLSNVRDLLGHSNIATTSRYLHSTPDGLAGAVARL